MKHYLKPLHEQDHSHRTAITTPSSKDKIKKQPTKDVRQDIQKSSINKIHEIINHLRGNIPPNNQSLHHISTQYRFNAFLSDFLVATAHIPEKTILQGKNCIIATIHTSHAKFLNATLFRFYKDVRFCHLQDYSINKTTYYDAAPCMAFGDFEGSRSNPHMKLSPSQNPDHIHAVFIYRNQKERDTALVQMQAVINAQYSRIELKACSDPSTSFGRLLSYCGKAALNPSAGSSFQPILLPYAIKKPNQQKNLKTVAIERAVHVTSLEAKIMLPPPTALAKIHSQTDAPHTRERPHQLTPVATQQIPKTDKAPLTTDGSLQADATQRSSGRKEIETDRLREIVLRHLAMKKSKATTEAVIQADQQPDTEANRPVLPTASVREHSLQVHTPPEPAMACEEGDLAACLHVTNQPTKAMPTDPSRRHTDDGAGTSKRHDEMYCPSDLFDEPTWSDQLLMDLDRLRVAPDVIREVQQTIQLPDASDRYLNLQVLLGTVLLGKNTSDVSDGIFYGIIQEYHSKLLS